MARMVKLVLEGHLWLVTGAGRGHRLGFDGEMYKAIRGWSLAPGTHPAGWERHLY